MNWKVCAS